MRLQACSGLIRSHQAGSCLSRPGHFSGLTTHACSCLIRANHIFPGWYINIWRGKKKKINWQRQKYRNNKKETAKRKLQKETDEQEKTDFEEGRGTACYPVIQTVNLICWRSKNDWLCWRRENLVLPKYEFFR